MRSVEREFVLDSLDWNLRVVRTFVEDIDFPAQDIDMVGVRSGKTTH